MNNHKNNMSEMLNPMDKKKNCFHHRPIAANHEFYLLGTIKSADDYIDWFDIIRHSGKNDNINIDHLFINIKSIYNDYHYKLIYNLLQMIKNDSLNYLIYIEGINTLFTPINNEIKAWINTKLAC